MGIVSSVEAKTKDVLLIQRLLDLKQKKRERDIQQSMALATTRDRLLWIGGYYTLLGAVAGVRHLVMHRRGFHFTWDTFFLPLNQVAVCLPPFLLGYQLDYALFAKGERIEAEAARIRNGAPHRWFDSAYLPQCDDRDRWFNQPLNLPVGLRPTYERVKAKEDAARVAAGLKPEPDWARFD
eukprot:CAMPEP_0174728028 /NCGR_PEP_ID=MMETSP1094-20130205/50921_1 /TAXON_ID=156173 /ORGANISM="Chrysochromulina brevifilum, Strain UTEX LB 985" /LENGTH=180 /DNA_ID=CAMNT_0015929879 /DNA_START=34 /DNA_END=576 /DNA_ORIENTATION=-